PKTNLGRSPETNLGRSPETNLGRSPETNLGRSPGSRRRRKKWRRPRSPIPPTRRCLCSRFPRPKRRETLRGVSLRAPCFVGSFVVIAAFSCSRQPVGPSPNAADAAADGSATSGLDTVPIDAGVDGAPTAIGAAGGIHRGEGTQLVIPP